MVAGRKTQPTALKVIKGNPGKRPLPSKEAKIPPSKPVPPDFLLPDAKAEWERIIDTLYLVGIVTEFDRAALAAYCQAYGRWAEAERMLNVPGTELVLISDKGNHVQNPLVGIANKARVDMVKFASEFGMTPAARSKVEANPVGEETDSEKFFS